MKRTKVNFEKHIVDVVKQDNFLMHHIRIPGTIRNNIKFINTNGIMAITGDFGNWIFCREFHPSAEGYVSDGYWEEKLSILSTQKYKEYNSENTVKAINRLLDNKEEEELTEEEIEYLNDCIYYSDDEIEYKHHAFRNSCGMFDDYERVPFEETNNIWLDIIFDAFDEICRRYKEGLLTE